MLLFHRGTWSNPYVKDTVSISQHLLQPYCYYKRSVVDSKKIERYVYLRRAIVALLFERPIYST